MDVVTWLKGTTSALWWESTVDAARTVILGASTVSSALSECLPNIGVRAAVRSLSVLGLGGTVLVAQLNVASYVRTEGPIARAGMLANIGPDGIRVPGAYPGVVVASPSKADPDYFFNWVRDSALVFKCIIDQYAGLEGNDPALRTLIDNFVSAEATYQHVPNPSGDVDTGGLGEPKFQVNLKAFEGDWGRPQRDGPALRATAVIAYANWLLENNNASYVNETLWPIIDLDLAYVAEKWNQSTFDLWEEISSSSFYTTAVQHRMLREGVTLAKKIGKVVDVEEYAAQADNVLCFMQTYWNEKGNFTVSNTGGGRSGVDANSNLASIHTFDPEAGCDAVTFQPCSDKALASLKTFIDSFRDLWPINAGVPRNRAVATGRYPEDVYYDGNPWYLTTFGVAEQLYHSLNVWNAQGSLEITPVSLSFFRQFSPSVGEGKYVATSRDRTFETLTRAIRIFADDFIAVNARYTPSDGALAEQYSKKDGSPLSAAHLTWSYASSLTAFAARKGTEVKSWGAKGLVVPRVCVGNPGPQVTMIFNVEANTRFGEDVFITGSTDSLKSWSAEKAIPLRYNWRNGKNIWSATLNLTASEHIEYKYLRKENGRVTWESDPNRRYKTPTHGTSVIEDVWR